MSEPQANPQLPWLDLWQYGSELPLVLAGPFAPLMVCGMPPTGWANLLNTYALLPAAMLGGLTNSRDPA